MPRFAYVNGRYRPHAHAMVHVEDRGYQFADGVYEVVPVRGGRLVDEGPHLDRLDRSLQALRIGWPVRRASLRLILQELLRRNALQHGLLYLQVTRGVAPREHKFPKQARPSLVVTTKRTRPPAEEILRDGVDVLTRPDLRWHRRDIKSTGLLPNVLAKQEAVEAGAFEAWLLDEAGFVTEGTSTNAWIVTADGELVTRDLGHAILSGITRAAVIELARAQGLRLRERPFHLTEARAAREAFLTSSSSDVLPVTKIDGAPVGEGRPGPLTRLLRDAYAARIRACPHG